MNIGRYVTGRVLAAVLIALVFALLKTTGVLAAYADTITIPTTATDSGTAVAGCSAGGCRQLFSARALEGGSTVTFTGTASGVSGGDNNVGIMCDPASISGTIVGSTQVADGAINKSVTVPGSAGTSHTCLGYMFTNAGVWTLTGGQAAVMMFGAEPTPTPTPTPTPPPAGAICQDGDNPCYVQLVSEDRARLDGFGLTMVLLGSVSGFFLAGTFVVNALRRH